MAVARWQRRQTSRVVALRNTGHLGFEHLRSVLNTEGTCFLVLEREPVHRWCRGSFDTLAGGARDDVMGDVAQRAVRVLRYEHQPRQCFVRTACVVVGNDQLGILDHHPALERIAERPGAGDRAGDADAAAPRLVAALDREALWSPAVVVAGTHAWSSSLSEANSFASITIMSPSKLALERDGTTAWE